MENLNELKEVLIKCASLGPSGAELKPLSEADKEFIAGALGNATTGLPSPKSGQFSLVFSKMNEIIAKECSPGVEHYNMIEELEDAVEDTRAGNDFIRAGGVEVCIKLLSVPDARIIITTCNILANISQNNEVFAEHPACFTTLRHLLIKFKLQAHHYGDQTLAKLLYAASSIISGNDAVILKLVKDSVVGYLNLLLLFLDTSHPVVTERLRRLLARVSSIYCDPAQALRIGEYMVRGWVENPLITSIDYRDLEFPPKIYPEKLEFLYTDVCRRALPEFAGSLLLQTQLKIIKEFIPIYYNLYNVPKWRDYVQIVRNLEQKFIELDREILEARRDQEVGYQRT